MTFWHVGHRAAEAPAGQRIAVWHFEQWTIWVDTERSLVVNQAVSACDRKRTDGFGQSEDATLY